MSSITTPIFKPLAMADISCQLLSHSPLFTSKIPYPIISIPTKPIKLQPLSCSHSTLFAPSFSLQRKNNPSSARVAFVAQNPETQLAVEEEEFFWENQELDDTGAPISDWESEGEDAAIVASGEGIVEGGVDGFVEEGEDNGGAYSELPEEAKIFVGNLPYDIDEHGLADLFNQAGTVEVAEVIFHRETKQSRGFGFVTMSTVEEAEKAVEKFHGQTVNGRSLTVNKAAPRGSRAERPPRASGPATRIYVGNLPWDVDGVRLEQIFSEHGKVVEARVVSDRETGRSRGFGFVTMSSQTEMDDAIAALDGETLNGRPIRVNVAEERTRRSFLSSDST